MTRFWKMETADYLKKTAPYIEMANVVEWGYFAIYFAEPIFGRSLLAKANISGSSIFTAELLASCARSLRRHRHHVQTLSAAPCRRHWPLHAGTATR